MERLVQIYLQLNSEYLKWILMADSGLTKEEKESINIALNVKGTI
jgi:hypothetical protein